MPTQEWQDSKSQLVYFMNIVRLSIEKNRVIDILI